MANEERGQQQVFQDVNPSELGQLTPSYTPYNSESQNQNRGRGGGLGREGENRQLGKATGQPRFSEMPSEDGLKAAKEAAKNLSQHQDFATPQQTAQQQDRSAEGREIAVHLHQVELDSRDQVKLDNREQEAIQKQPMEPVQQQGQPQLEVAKEQQQDKVPLDSADLNKLDTRLQGSEQQKAATATQSQEPQERKITQEKDQENDHER